jgi:hypothetical protein
MDRRYFSVVATIATSVTLACGDARLDDVTAPPPAAMPVTPVANEWPSEEEIAAAGIPSAIGMRVDLTPWFATDNLYFIVDAKVSFTWANYVSATIKASLINASGQQVNSGQAALSWYRMVVPVPSGDTTFTVRIATNNTTCGLTGKSTGSGKAAQRALAAGLFTVDIYEHSVGETSGPDVLQPTCPPDDCDGTASSRVIRGTSDVLRSESDDCDDDAPAPPGGGGDPEEGPDPTLVCFDLWREFWVYDFGTRQSTLIGQAYMGTFCYYVYQT